MNGKLTILASLLALAAAAEAAHPQRPVPRPTLLKRLVEGPEIIGIVHWGLNTFMNREWGFGDEDPAKLAPSAFDADQIVGACRAGGLGGLVVVAKHHDGFCLWPTKTTEHNISKSPFRNGRGDYVREMERACRRAGFKFGVYVSPWDRNSADYGTPRYVERFHAQIRELLSGDYGEIFEMWFDNANGGDGYYGGARETRKIPSDYYRFDRVFRFVRELQPNVCIFNEDAGADFRWPGNEKGILDPDCRATGRDFDIANYKDYMAWTNTGLTDGTCFHPPEADFPLRKGWFHHDGDAVKDGVTLLRRYLDSVGRGGTMNIGIAPDKTGRLCADDVRALADFGRLRASLFAQEVTKPGEAFDLIDLKEDVSKGERIDGWEFVGDGKVLASGKSVGIRRIRILDRPVAPQACALRVTKAADPVTGVAFRRYRVSDGTLRLLRAAEAAQAETETAKRMMKTR